MSMVASPDDPGEDRAVERYANDEFNIEMIPDGDSFKVVAAGLAKALGHRDALDLVRGIPADEKGYGVVRTPGGGQQAWTLTEAGFYRAIGQRQAARVKDQAMRGKVERFQSWVYGEVLPAIRKTGTYDQRPALPSNRDLALMVIAEADRADLAEAKVKELEPSAASWQTLASAEGDFAVADAAKILSRDGGIDVGRNRLFATLLEMRWIYRQQADSRPRAMQTAVSRGWLSELPQSHNHPETGELVLDPPQVRVTIKGLHELHKRLGGDGSLAIAG
jgi:prophage antirepressor-like protein